MALAGGGEQHPDQQRLPMILRPAAGVPESGAVVEPSVFQVAKLHLEPNRRSTLLKKLGPLCLAVAGVLVASLMVSFAPAGSATATIGGRLSVSPKLYVGG